MNHHLSDNSSKNLQYMAIANLADFISKEILNLKILNYDIEKKQFALEILNLNDKDYEFIYHNCENILDKIDTGIF